MVNATQPMLRAGELFVKDHMPNGLFRNPTRLTAIIAIARNFQRCYVRGVLY